MSYRESDSNLLPLTGFSGLHEVDEQVVDAGSLCQHQRLETNKQERTINKINLDESSLPTEQRRKCSADTEETRTTPSHTHRRVVGLVGCVFAFFRIQELDAFSL